MHTNKNKLFTIGQFAAIHGITKKTLIWYDEIDLLKPIVIGKMDIGTIPTIKALHLKRF